MTLLSPAAPATRLQVDIWSDIACPWCYVGKRRFEQALAQFSQPGAVEVVWHSFQLDPAAPLHDNRSMRDILAGKYGRSAEQAQELLDGMTQTAAAEGLEYHFELAQPANTFQAHQLVHLAAAHGLQDAMKERLLRAHFSEGAQVGDPGTLLRLAAEVGLNEAEVSRALEEQTYAAAVQRDQAQARAYGIGGVPFFVFGGQYGVSGAQSPETLLAALERLWNERQPLQLVAAPAEGCTDESCALP
ncbi:DsbA family oxidoreductase [Deinococcus sp.]|uniref:DsbA family oxidoreductase n=1 Tax=Deinococcus sp. TaxID=47478 RepID=UPI003CC51E6D